MRTMSDEHPLDFLEHTHCPACEILLLHDQVDGYDCPSCGARVLCETCGDNPLPGRDHCAACEPDDCSCDIDYICNARHGCSLCGRKKDAPEPGLCRLCEASCRTAGRQMAEARRFAREFPHG